MSEHRHVVALNTGGGDCPGLNAVIRAIVKRARLKLNWKIWGIEGSFDGLLSNPQRVRELDRDSIAGGLIKGGTILGSTSRGNPFKFPQRADSGNEQQVDASAMIAKGLQKLGCEGIIALGGDGSMEICHELSLRTGIKIIGVPKTIDNDLRGTDETFGFNSAVEFATQAVDRLHTTAESHDRIMVVEVMGRDAGFIALHAGIAGGADAILIPEIPFDLRNVVTKVRERQLLGRFFSIIVVAEGAKAKDGDQIFDALRESDGRRRLGGIGRWVAEQLHEMTGIDTRYTVLGHLQRGGIPSAYDRILATRLGNHAVDLVEEDRWNRLVVMRADRVTSIPLEDAIGGTKVVELESDTVATARGVGIVFGD